MSSAPLVVSFLIHYDAGPAGDGLHKTDREVWTLMFLSRTYYVTVRE